jgi:hypothetical protein
MFSYGIARRLKLLGNQVAGVDEHQIAGVEYDGPSPCRVNDMVVTDIHAATGHLAEIFDHDATGLSVAAGIHVHPFSHRYVAVTILAHSPSPPRAAAGIIAAYPISASMHRPPSKHA